MFSENMQDDIEKVLLSEEEIQEIVTRVGAEVSRDYRGKNLVLVSVLKGSVVFMADLMRAIDIPLSIDFMVVSSYGNGTESSGKVKIIKDLDLDLSGQDLLLVEDILEVEKNTPVGAIMIEIMEEDDVHIFAEHQYAVEDALCFWCDVPELLEKALRVYQGRAFYDGTCGMDAADLRHLVEKYGLIML